MTICPMFVFIILCIWLIKTSAECKNGCSGHGRCTVFDMCICHRNWQSNDCSESNNSFAFLNHTLFLIAHYSQLNHTLLLFFTKSDNFVGVCSQGLSFVDSPKGDLDFSGAIDSPDELVVVNSEQFPYGTTEQFPDMRFVFALNSFSSIEIIRC